MKKLIRTALATATIAATGFGVLTPVATAGAAVTEQNVSATVDCSATQNINVSAYVRGLGSNQYAYLRLVFFKWNPTTQKWGQSGATNYISKQAPGMGVPFTWPRVPASPGYYQLRIDSWMWDVPTQSWTNGLSTWPSTYTVRATNGGTFQSQFCLVK